MLYSPYAKSGFGFIFNLRKLYNCFIDFVNDLIALFMNLWNTLDNAYANSSFSQWLNSINAEQAIPFRNVSATVLCFTVAYFALIFDINKKDKHGRSIKQEDHFQLLRIELKLRSINSRRKSKEINNKKYYRLPSTLFSPYIALMLAYPASLFLFHFGYYKWVVILSSFSFIFSCIYVGHTLRIMYCPNWLLSRSKRILRKAYKHAAKADDVKMKKLSEIVHDTYQTIAENDMISARGIIDVFFNKKRIIKKMLNNSVSINELFVYATGLHSFMVSYCIANAREKNQGSINTVMKQLVPDILIGKPQERPTALPIVIAWIFACYDLNELIANNPKRIEQLKACALELYGWIFNSVPWYADAAEMYYIKLTGNDGNEKYKRLGELEYMADKYASIQNADIGDKK